MKVLILCVALSVLVSVTAASPVKTQIRDESNSSDNSDSSELNNFEENLSSFEEEKAGVHEYKGKADEEGSSGESSEERSEKYINIKDTTNGYREVNSKDHYDIKEMPGKFKRSLDFASSSRNQLTLNDERSQKHDKSFKAKLLKGALESDVSKLRFVRQADTSKEHSSEESKEDKKNAVQIAAASNLKPQDKSVKTEGSRRRRTIDVSSEEERSLQDHDVNEVFIFSNENPHDSQEDFEINSLKRDEDVYEKLKRFRENKNSEEDYAQGCGENDDNQDDHTGENSDENNETAIDKL